MREIKFRAWNKWHKNMFYVYCLDFDNDIAGCKSINNGTTHTFGFIDLELLQLTGLKDKKGKDIYEGDIIKRDLTDQEEYDLGNYVYGVIEFHDSGCFYEKLTHQCGTTRVYWEKIDPEESVIVGNIYENPELLNGD